MAKYKKRPDGRYQANICIGYDSSKKRKFKTVYGRSIAELERNKSEILADLARGTYSDDEGYTLGTYAKEWLEAYKSDLSASTYHGYRNIIANHFSGIQDIRLKDLKKTDIQAGMNVIEGYDLKRRYRLTMNQILETAIDDGLIYKNVSRGIQLPKASRKEKRALTEEEKKALFKAKLTPKEKAFVCVLYYAGLRRGEALALTRTDINLKSGTIAVNKSLEFIGNSSGAKSPKTSAGNREVPLIEPLGAVLKSYMQHQRNLVLFPNSSGQYMSGTSYKRFWNQIYRKINEAAGGTHHWEGSKVVFDINAIQGLTPHIFRHNYATMLYYAGVDLKEAIRILGHADSKTTLDIYTHLDQNKSNSGLKLQEYMAAQKI